MEVLPRQIIYYKTLDNKIPYRIFYEGIKDTSQMNIIDRRLERVEKGNYGDCKPVGEGVLELRFKRSGLRIYFAEITGLVVLLLCGGDKENQDKDIRKAKEYWTECRTRK